MKNSLVLAIVLSGMMLNARAATVVPSLYTLPTSGDVTFTPNPSDIWDLDHHYYYTWGIENIAIPSGYQISKAELTFQNINNWNNNDNWLYLYLLDSADITGAEQADALAGKLNAYGDNPNDSSNDDAFKEGGAWQLLNPTTATRQYIATYQDLNGTGTSETKTYSLGALGLLGTLDTYIKNGNDFGIGFDPDCHYNNNGVTLTVAVSRIPQVPDAGATAWLLVVGLGAMRWVGRRIQG